MGQVMRIMSYSQSRNISNTVTIPSLKINGAELRFHKLDDGVMGGLSSTRDDLLMGESGNLLFTGEINTNGGGFASIRSPLDHNIPQTATGIKLRFRGDGKTYKVLLSNGSPGVGGPFSRSPSWQADLVTEKRDVNEPSQEIFIPFDSFRPSFGGRGASRVEEEQFTFVNSEMQQIGLMLSLKLSSGESNPHETFGTGIFDFTLEVENIELIMKE